MFFFVITENIITFALAFGWFRSSVGLEQQPSKLWVLGSNPSGITLNKELFNKALGGNTLKYRELPLFLLLYANVMG